MNAKQRKIVVGVFWLLAVPAAFTFAEQAAEGISSPLVNKTERLVGTVTFSGTLVIFIAAGL